MTKRKVVGAVVLVVGLVLAAGVVGTLVTSKDEGTESSAPLRVLDGGDASEEAQADDSVASGGGGGGAAGGAGAFAGAESSGEPMRDGSALSAVPIPGSTRVIKNADLQVEVEEGRFQEQFSRATAVAEELGGFVSSSQVSEHEGELNSGNLTMRVPADRFEAAVARLKELGEVAGESRSGRDVTREFVDLEARLRQARTEEGFFVRLLDEADSISDLIQIQSQLSDVQLRIEQLQGQLNFLEDQTELSTITVRIFEPGAEEFRPVEGLAEAWERAAAGFQTVVAGAIISLGWLAPFALLGGIVFAIYRFTGRRGVRRSGAQGPSKEDEDQVNPVQSG